jgi:hypothetical protein
MLTFVDISKPEQIQKRISVTRKTLTFPDIPKLHQLITTKKPPKNKQLNINGSFHCGDRFCHTGIL